MNRTPSRVPGTMTTAPIVCHHVRRSLQVPPAPLLLGTCAIPFNGRSCPAQQFQSSFNVPPCPTLSRLLFPLHPCPMIPPLVLCPPLSSFLLLLEPCLLQEQCSFVFFFLSIILSISPYIIHILLLSI